MLVRNLQSTLWICAKRVMQGNRTVVLIYYLDNFYLSRQTDSAQNKLLQCLEQVVANDMLIRKYPTYVQQFIYLRVARAAASCSAIFSLKYAIGRLTSLPSSTMQKFYWKQVEYELDRGVLRRDFSIGSDAELNHDVCNWRDICSRNSTNQLRGIKKKNPASLYINRDNVGAVFALLRTHSVGQYNTKRLVHQMIAQEHYEYAVDLLEWYGSTLAPTDATEAELQAKAYFMCCEFGQAVELLKRWGLSGCDLYHETMRWARAE